jgi:hypothetical protein
MESENTSKHSPQLNNEQFNEEILAPVEKAKTPS